MIVVVVMFILIICRFCLWVKVCMVLMLFVVVLNWVVYFLWVSGVGGGVLVVCVWMNLDRCVLSLVLFGWCNCMSVWICFVGCVLLRMCVFLGMVCLLLCRGCWIMGYFYVGRWFVCCNWCVEVWRVLIGCGVIFNYVR